jgi:hypothetical protein
MSEKNVSNIKSEKIKIDNIMELIKSCKNVNKNSKVGIFLGMALEDKVIIYCSEKDTKLYLKNTILNKNTQKIILDDYVVISILI